MSNQLPDNDFSWAKEPIFTKLAKNIPADSNIEKTLEKLTEPNTKEMPKALFVNTLLKITPEIMLADLEKFAGEIMDKATEKVELKKFCEIYKNSRGAAILESQIENPIAQKPIIIEENLFEEIRKLIFDGFFDIIEIFSEFDSTKTGKISYPEFEKGILKIADKSEFSKEKIQKLFDILRGKLELAFYKDFSKKLEDYSLSKISIPKNNPNLPIIEKIRTFIRTNSINIYQTIFKPIVTKNLNKKWITKKDFKDALLKCGISLDPKNFDDFCIFLDPQKADQIDYDYFCELLGYIEYGEKIKEESKIEKEKIPKITDPKMKECLAKLNQHINIKNINLLELYKKEDSQNLKILSQDAILSVINKIRFLGDFVILSQILDLFPKDPQNNINYADFINLIMESSAPQDLIPTVKANNSQEIILQIAECVKAGDYKLAEICEDQSNKEKGIIQRTRFIEILKNITKTKQITELEFKNLADYFEDPINPEEIKYKIFLSQLDLQLSAIKSQTALRTNLQWAGNILDELCVALYCRKEAIQDFFKYYGMNPTTKTMLPSGFDKAMRDLKIEIKDRELKQLKEDLDLDYDGNISVQEISYQLDQRKEKALSKFELEVMTKIEEFVKARNIDLYSIFKKHDSYNSREINSKNFETELRIILKANLSETQYKFITTKYEKRKGKVAYVDFITEIMNNGKGQSKDNIEIRMTLIDKLRENMHSQDIKIATKLLSINKDTKIYQNLILLELFPQGILTNDDLELLTSLVDEKKTGSFSHDLLTSILWTNEEEEFCRPNAMTLAKETNTKIKGFCQNRKIDLENEFMKLDNENSGFLHTDQIQQIFFNLGMRFSDKQLSVILYGQGLQTDSKFRKSYIDLALKIFDKTTLPDKLAQNAKEGSILESRKPQTATHPGEDSSKASFNSQAKEQPDIRPKTSMLEEKKESIPDMPISPPREVKLDNETINYCVEHCAAMRKYLNEKGVDMEAEFGKFDKDGYIDFADFVRVLQIYQVDLRTQSVADTFYSYLKEEPERKISMRRLREALIQGKRLTQFKSKALLQHEQVLKSEIIATGLHIKHLADYMVQSNISVNVFKNYAPGGRAIKRDQLEKALKDMNYQASPEQFDALFKAIDIKSDGVGSLPHLMAILSEQSIKKDQPRPQASAEMMEITTELNKELTEKNISGPQLYKLLDLNGDGYVDKTEFVTGLTKLGIKTAPEKLATFFTIIDINQTGMVSINTLLLHIQGAKLEVDERIRELTIDEQISLEIEKLFERLDLDHNGVLSEDELYQAISASSHNKYSREEVKEIMKVLDTDKSGAIDKHEFEQFMLDQIKKDILLAEDEMQDLRIKFKEYDLDGNGWLSPDEIYTLLRKDYPAIRIEDLEAVFSEIDTNKDGKIDIDELISYMHGSTQALQMDKDSKKYRAIMTLKHQRRFSPNDFLNYFEKISASILYVPSFTSELHNLCKNLPSESFRITRDASGLGYVDVKPVIGTDKKPTKQIQEIPPVLAGYIVLDSSAGIPIPDPAFLKRENIVNRTVKILFYDTKATKFIHGSCEVQCAWDENYEDVWSFNGTGEAGSNPIVFKWCDNANLDNIDIIFEFVSSMRYF